MAHSREFWLDTESLEREECDESFNVCKEARNGKIEIGKRGPDEKPREASKGWAWRVGGCADQAGDRERRARSRFSEAGEGGGGVIKIANILSIGNVSWVRSEAKRSGGHLSVAGGRSRT